MYEHMTFQSIIKAMLDMIPNDLDKREGSVLYNALAPVAIELQNAYIEMDTILNLVFVDTTEGIYLTKKCHERGIERQQASKAILKGEFNIDVPIGSRYYLEGLHYIVTEQIKQNTFKLQCETAGEQGNHYLGKMIPVEYIPDLTTANLIEVLIPGENVESDQSLRQRYYDSLFGLAFGGNIADYKQKVLKMQGVGAVKVYPVWQGGGTVKLVLLDSECHAPSQELVDMVQTAIDPTQNQGQGLGLAPIGHVVTVVGAGETVVNVSAHITYQNGYYFDRIQSALEKTIEEYFQELNETWGNEINLVVRISRIESRILDLEGVLDVSDTTLNGTQSNIEIGADNIVKKGEVHEDNDQRP